MEGASVQYPSFWAAGENSVRLPWSRRVSSLTVIFSPWFWASPYVPILFPNLFFSKNVGVECMRKEMARFDVLFGGYSAHKRLDVFFEELKFFLKLDHF